MMRYRPGVDGTTCFFLREVFRMFDDDSLSKLTSLQYAWKREGLQLSGNQNRLAKSGDEFFTHLKQVLAFDLRLYAQGRSDIDDDLGEVIYKLYRGAVLTRYFSSDAADAELAQQLMDAISSDLSVSKSQSKSRSTPIELRDPNWFNFMVSWQRQNEPQQTDAALASDSEISFQEICIFIQKCAAANPAFERRTIGLLTLIANHLSQQAANATAIQLRSVFDHDRPLFELIIDQRLLERIWLSYSVGGVAEFLEALTFISEKCTAPILGVFISQLCNQVKTTKELTTVIIHLKTLANHEGVAKETLELLTVSQQPDKAKVFIQRAAGFESGPLSIDAQRIMVTILSKYKLDAATVNELGNRISEIGLCDSLASRLCEKIVQDSEFAGRLVKKRFKTDSLLTRWEDSVGFASRIFTLVLIAIQEFSGPSLGSITRGLSVLTILKEKSMIDDSHYRMLMSDMTQDLPGSLSRLHEQPDSMELKLRQLYIPLSVSGDLLHQSDNLTYFSDTFYEMRQRDRGQQQ
jgi:hypothetical protein